MRKLMWFSVGFAVSCALGVWVLPLGAVLPAAVVTAALSGLCVKGKYRRMVFALAGCAVGLCWYFGFAKLFLGPARSLDGTTLETSVTATGYSYETDYGVAVDGEFEMEGTRYQIRLYVNSAREIAPGDTAAGRFLLRYTAPGGNREPTYHAGEGTLFLGYERGNSRIEKASENIPAYSGIRLNRNIGRLLSNLFPEDVESFARALLLGDDYDLSYETDTALKISGIRHIVAVSGLHVAILYTMLRAITLNRRWLTALIGLPVLYLFAAVALFTPSVTRACIMVALMILAQLLDKEYDPPTALGFAVLVMLLLNPLAVTSVSFQMSVACVAGILLFQSGISRWIYEKTGMPRGKTLNARLKRWFVSSVSVSVSATVLTVPMSAWYFGTVSLAGVLTNLLTLWAVSMAFYGIVAVCLVSLFWMKGAVFLAALTALPMRYVLWMAKAISAFPLAAVYTKSVYIVFWLVFVYGLLGIFLFSKNKHPRELLCCAVLGFCLALLISWTEHTFSDTHFTALDVGQGQCLILHHDGKTFLIDCGGSNDEIAADEAAETLLSRGITKVDGIILTHGDRDHSGGIRCLLKRVDAGFIMLPATAAPETAAALTEGFSGEVIPVEEACLIQTDRGYIRVFGPTYASESNENSLCVLFESENCAILVTGDRSRLGELILLHENKLPDVDLLMAGHHGSGSSTGEELLAAVSPETVFISVGENNGYGHPTQTLLDRLTSFGCEVYRTDQNGTLIFRR